MQRLATLVHKLSYSEIGKESSAAINHTGDGFLCVFWDKLHSITALRVALAIRSFLSDEVPKLNSRLDAKEDLAIDFGIALHCISETKADQVLLLLQQKWERNVVRISQT